MSCFTSTTDWASLALPVLLVCASAAACSPEGVQGTSSSEEEVIAKKQAYRPTSLSLSCMNEGAAPSDGVVSSVKVTSVMGKAFFSVVRWQVLPGFDQPVEATSGGEVRSVVRSKDMTITGDAEMLVVSDTRDGGLDGTFTTDGKTVSLSCRPNKFYCATPKEVTTDHPLRRVVIARTGEVVDLQTVITGVLVEELTLHTTLKSFPYLTDVTIGLDPDPDGKLEANGAHVEDARVGVVDVVWDAISKKRVATFSPADDVHFEVPKGGFPVAHCEIAEPAAEAPSSM